MVMQANQLTEEEEQGNTINVFGQSPQKEGLKTYEQQAQPAQPVSVSGKAPATVGTDQATSTGPTEPTGSGLFTNIRKFVEANKGAGQQIAGTAKEKVGGRAADVGQAVAKKESELQTNIQQATGQAQNVQTEAEKILTSASTTGQLTPEQIEKFRGAATGTTFQEAPEFDIEQEQRQTENIARQAELAQTAPGRFGLLREFFGTPEQRYGHGLQRLDVAFLQQDPTARQDIATGLRDISTATQQEITDAEKLAMAEDTGLIPKYQKQIQNIQTGLETGLEEATKAATAAPLTRGQTELATRNKFVRDIEQSIAETNSLLNLSDEQLVKLGFTPTEVSSARQSYQTLKDYLINTPPAQRGEEYWNLLMDNVIPLAKMTGANIMGEEGRVATGDEVSQRGVRDLLQRIEQVELPETELRRRFMTEEDVARGKALARLAGSAYDDFATVGEELQDYIPAYDIASVRAQLDPMQEFFDKYKRGELGEDAWGAPLFATSLAQFGLRPLMQYLSPEEQQYYQYLGNKKQG